MDTFAVQIFPVARPGEWAVFMDSAERGERADAHREMLARIGVRREHIYRQDTPDGTVMVLVWEGVDQDDVADRMAEMLSDPQSEHERYVATYVIPVLHGVDPAAGPPPEVQRIALIEA